MIDRRSHCGSKKYVKDGKAWGKQRYVCKDAGVVLDEGNIDYQRGYLQCNCI
jgi:transcription initiation factor TFIIIB Brf1 subunit/transcription initiation factor TFIIB